MARVEEQLIGIKGLLLDVRADVLQEPQGANMKPVTDAIGGMATAAVGMVTAMCPTVVFRRKRRVGAAEDACIAWRPNTSLCLVLVLPTHT